MGRDSRRPKVVPRFDPLEVRALMSADGSLGQPTPASSAFPPELVAIVDSGIDLNASDPTHFNADPKFLDLTDAYNAVLGTYGQSAVTDGSPGLEGTRVANYLAQGIADGIAAGGTSNVQIVPIRTYDTTTDGSPFYALVNGIYHAVDIGASVIDLGFVAGSNVLDASEVQQLETAIQTAQTDGIVVVTPAGDGFNPGGSNIDQPGGTIDEYPADFHTSNMIVVASTDGSGNLGGASNWGATHVDLGAPLPLADRVTPFAAAYVAGVADVVASTRRDWTAVQVVNRIKQTVTPDPAIGGKVTTSGLINAANALNGIYSVTPTETPGAFDGGLKSDFALYGNFGGGYVFELATASQGFESAYPTVITNNGYSVGGAGSIPVSGDYYGTGVSEPAIYGPELGPDGKPDGKYDFAILSQNAQGVYNVSTFVQGFGGSGDIPVAGNFSGSGKADFAVYGYHNGEYNFAVLTSASGFSLGSIQYIDNNGYSFGGPGDVPVVGDYFGDGKDDPAIYGPEFGSNGQPDGNYDFAALDGGTKNAQGQFTRSAFARGFGSAGDIPVVGDFDGDGKSDLALYGNTYGRYDFVVLTAASGFNLNALTILDNNGQGFGGPGSVPIAGDFDGDGTADPAVYGPEFGSNAQPDGQYNFAYLGSKSRNGQGQYTQGQVISHFGGSTAIAAAAPPIVKWFQAGQG